MRLASAAVLFGVLLSGCTTGPRTAGLVEQGYARGSLGVAAIERQDWAAAEAGLLAVGRDFDDPARLINLGEVYYRTDRLKEARAAWARALESDRHHDVLLRNGQTVSTAAVARTALRRLDYAALNR